MREREEKTRHFIRRKHNWCVMITVIQSVDSNLDTYLFNIFGLKTWYYKSFYTQSYLFCLF